MSPDTPDPRPPWAALLTVSAGVCGFLLWLIYVKPPAADTGGWSRWLQPANAILNSLCATCLVGGWLAIKRGRRTAHIRLMLAAVGWSALFGVSYITYHHFKGDTKFGGTGPIRVAYLVLLASHVLTSIVALPMVLATLWLAARGQYERHRKIARWTLPVWLYVSVTGVLVYVVLTTLG